MALNPNSVEKVNIFLNAEGLPKIPTFSNTDPFAVLYCKDIVTGALEKTAMTDVINDTNDPRWTTAVVTDYMFEMVQEMTVKLYHAEAKTRPITDESKHTFLGEVHFVLSDLMRSRTGGITLDITGGHKKGKVVIRGEAQVNTRDLFCVTFSGNKLANRDGFFGTSDPFLEVSRCNEDGKYNSVWKSSKVDNSLSPKWSEVKIPMSTLCNGDLDRPLRIQVLDWDSNGKHQSMGVVNTSVRAMMTNNGAGMDVIEADKQSKTKGYTNSGHITAANVRIEHYPTFSEFIQGGCEVNMIVALDFTGSNGDPRSHDSLHYHDASGKLNPYQNAISSVGKVLQQYDTDKKYTVFGFGARLKQANGEFSPVQHCFPVYSGGAEVNGVEGILKAYQECLDVVMLSGPTLFGPLIQGAHYIANAANCSQANQKYTILLVITDDAMTDIDATKDAIIAASGLPLSIVIIGVGAADFSEMKVLDSDKELLRHGSHTAERDIVQFFQYRDAAKGPAYMAQQVLAEIPTQFLKYMEQHHIVPNKA